nr:DUF1800 domain-containing protein [Rivibacter subsaxonicus]
MPAAPGPIEGSQAFSATALAAAAASLLAACGGGGGGEAAAAPAPPAVPVVLAEADTEAARFLQQAQFSASDAAITSVKSLGPAAWLDQQMELPTGETAWDWLNSRGYDTISDTTRYYDSTYPADHAIWRQLMSASDPVRRRMALAMSEFFVVSLSGIDVTWRSHFVAHYWDQLNANAFGNFRTLLEDVTLNPAMGVYLNTRGNQKEDARTGRQPDENYAREVMQLFSIGLYKLNLDGTPQLGGDGNPIESYAQDDVTNLARVFTGYDFDNTGNLNTVEPIRNRTIGNTLKTRLPMTADSARHPSPSTNSRHSSLAATFLGVTIAANTDSGTALKTALDTLFNHENVGPFFGRQMIQRLVTSDPSPAYVARVAAAFNNNGSGVRGDLRAVWRAVLLDAEARGAAGLTAAGWGKLREPMLRFIQWGRTFGLHSIAGSWKIGDLSNNASSIGQSPLRSPSVFNYFRPGYVPAGTALAASRTPAPEFQIVNETTVSGYLNFMQSVVKDGLRVNSPGVPHNDSTSSGYDVVPDYAAELALVTDSAALVARLNLLLCAGQLSSATQTIIINALDATALSATSADALKLNRVAAAVLLVLACSEYLVQK